MYKLHKSAKYVRLYNKIMYDKHGLVGTMFASIKSGKFKVLCFSGKIDNDGHKLYKIKFIHTGEEFVVRKIKILNGEIRDYMYPTVAGIGFLGKDYPDIFAKDKELCKNLRHRWKNLIHRIYNPRAVNYQNYGALGVSIDPKWHEFSKFYKDIMSLPNFNREQMLNRSIDIDKDILQPDIDDSNKIYSKETVTLVSHTNNMKHVDYDKVAANQSKYFIVIDKNDNAYLEKSVTRFAKNHNTSNTNICKILNDKLYNKTIRGYRYRFPTDEEQKLIDDGILKVGDKII